MSKVDLSKYSNTHYNPGSSIKRALWYLINVVFFKSPIPLPYQFKISLLKIFGAKVGSGIIIKPCVNIKYPWFLQIGNNVWIGENAWIDNLAQINIGDNVCISQGAFLLTGNHNYKLKTFDLITQTIEIEEGVWVGAKVIVCPGVTLATHSVISVGSVISKNTESYGIYRGVPAELVAKRVIDNLS